MQITRTSPFSGITKSIEIPCTEEQMAAYKDGALIQIAFPDLTADQREFILTGITKEEWDELFKETDESDGGNDEPAL